MSCHFRTVVRTRGGHIAVPGGSLTQLGAIVLWRAWRDHSLQAYALIGAFASDVTQWCVAD